ncbi:hypothetical protein [Peptoniphilus vaginalis]|uniref:hypothetical protein n=1 Tax=Peptoniphilus vaginalis TaxID=1756987 RepID=UPI0023F6BEA6|nr:hypothetical protein [Peptoniphilus vaginalis]
MKVRNLLDGTIYAVGNTEEELINDWNENCKKNLEWILELDTEETYNDLTDELFRMENLEDAIDDLNEMSDNNNIIIEK